MKAVSLFVATMLLSVTALASPCPHPARGNLAKQAFVKLHACPATSKHQTHCPGYVIDHLLPLCDCGKDAPGNMQWEKFVPAKKKDRLESQLCAGKITRAQFDAAVRKLPK